MKTKDSPNRKIAELRKKATELEQKKDAWKRYETNLRHARSGYSELELDDF